MALKLLSRSRKTIVSRSVYNWSRRYAIAAGQGDSIHDFMAVLAFEVCSRTTHVTGIGRVSRDVPSCTASVCSVTAFLRGVASVSISTPAPHVLLLRTLYHQLAYTCICIPYMGIYSWDKYFLVGQKYKSTIYTCIVIMYIQY